MPRDVATGDRESLARGGKTEGSHIGLPLLQDPFIAPSWGRPYVAAHVVVAACGIKGKAAKEQRVIKESWHNENR